MKVRIFAMLTIGLAIGGVGGFYLGWKSGVKDGYVLAEMPVVSLVENYSKARQEDDNGARDRAMDILSRGLASNFVSYQGGHPFAMSLRPKVEYSLLRIAAIHELNSELPNPWPGGAVYSLLAEDSKKKEKFDRVLRENANLYQKILTELESRRSTP